MKNETFFHEFIVGIGMETKMKFLMGLKVPKSNRGSDTVIFL
jgi:hypothetical protein